jgi:hypothetical protein
MKQLFTLSCNDFGRRLLLLINAGSQKYSRRLVMAHKFNISDLDLYTIGGRNNRIVTALVLWPFRPKFVGAL